MQQVRGRMIGRKAAAPFLVNLGKYRIADGEPAHPQFAFMAKDTSTQFLCVFNLKNTLIADQFASITHLSAAFSIKWCAIQDNNSLIHFINGIDLGTFMVNGKHSRIALGTVVTHKDGLCFLDDKSAIHFETVRGTSPLPLPGHGFLKTAEINNHTLLSGNVGGQIQRKSIGIIKLENGFSIQGTIALADGFIQKQKTPF
jgi:hypothetical protein